ncbi:unnamed protein product [Paramecium primaurelia]|uniref:Uncharacterized protein n=1 Tax=Paramecium primaurelia TaxID=5886 RepID=A0A8S1NEN0_PARPR|nr:unnamed protein product [Paramecium primaurelia]
MKNKQFKEILSLQVVKVELTQKVTKINAQEPIHYGVIVTTQNQEKYVLHNGHKFGKDQDFVLTSFCNTSNSLEIFETYELDKPIKLEVFFLAGCCGQNMRYHPKYNNSKHAQDRILQKVKELTNQSQLIVE